jgi:hypothetical protein
MRSSFLMLIFIVLPIQGFGCAQFVEPTQDQVPSGVRAVTSALGEEPTPAAEAGDDPEAEAPEPPFDPKDPFPYVVEPPGPGTACEIGSSSVTDKEVKDADLELRFYGSQLTLSVSQATTVTYTADFLKDGACSLESGAPDSDKRAVIMDESLEVKCSAALSGTQNATISKVLGAQIIHFNWQFGGTLNQGKTVAVSLGTSIKVKDPIRIQVRGLTVAEAQIRALSRCRDELAKLSPGVPTIRADLWNTWLQVIKGLRVSDFTITEPWYCAFMVGCGLGGGFSWINNPVFQ